MYLQSAKLFATIKSSSASNQIHADDGAIMKASNNERTVNALRKIALKLVSKKIKNMDDMTDKANGEYMLQLCDGKDLKALALHARAHGYKWEGIYA